MNLAKATTFEKKDLERRVRLGYGEYFTVKTKDIDENDEIIDVENTYYIGRMNAGQTGGVLSILAAIFVNGNNAKEDEGRVDNAVFIEFLDAYHLTLLASLILGEDREFVDAEWDFTGWVMDAVKVFFKYNNFFVILQKVTEMVQSMGLTETVAKEAITGKKSNLTLLP